MSPVSSAEGKSWRPQNLKKWRRFFRDVTLRHRWGLYVVPSVSRQHSDLLCEGFQGTSDPWWWHHYPVSKRWQPNTLWRVVTSQKNRYLISTAEKTLKLANFKNDHAMKRVVDRAMSDNVGHRLLPTVCGKYLSWSWQCVCVCVCVCVVCCVCCVCVCCVLRVARVVCVCVCVCVCVKLFNFNGSTYECKIHSFI